MVATATFLCFFFFQAEDGIRDGRVTGVQTCALPIYSHSHPIRGGLYYNLELRWDGVPALADGLRMLRGQAQRTPPNQWGRVGGGWAEFQFAEKRMPTLDALDTAAREPPVLVLHLYAMAL